MKKFIFIVLLFCISQSAFAEQKNAPAKVIMNNQELTQVQLAEIKKVYGVQPKSGKYWCDKTSGLWGQWEGPAMGFLFPKHCVGELSPSASKGSSKVFINNREVSQNEALWWTARAGGGYPMPGKYTLDQQGNLAGLNAFGVPFVVNVIQAANAHGQGGSWSQGGTLHRSFNTGIGSGSQGGCNYVIGSDFSYSGPGC
ncbi:MAG: hypothetical protein A3I05_03295 [Deltaproteobacteria bacterium RIFCSPLOWO2_02_FULL_44_10]|nr:MAG: hypothetical protein A3C46_02870 [Deltaproteobacteria bacterium RIFCSPHIGHO2_02_FULL_44_16]OGQ46199.1 MAG: hypothetical protein A3I05_03295 [Deltaproteobacteria bacterium RIFCSPLOWO2_02_FULL_44_10]